MNLDASQSGDEVSLRDIYLILKRWSRFIFFLSVGLMISTLIFSLLWPKTYTSQVVVSLSLANQSNQGLLNNLPSLAGLAQGFVDLQQTRLLANQLDVDDPTRDRQSRSAPAASPQQPDQTSQHNSGMT